MEKHLRSSLETSADEFLSSAAKLELTSSKSSLKTLIHSLPSSFPITSSLPASLYRCITHSVPRFGKDSDSPAGTPPTKRLCRSEDVGDVGMGQNEAQNLQVYTYISLLCISHPKRIFSPSDLLPSVKELHDNLIIFASDSALCSEIVSLCEEWWKGELPERETLISQSLPYLLSRSLEKKKKVDIHRIYLIREAFTLFDFEDKSIEDVKLLLIRCLISSEYLSTEDGKKFVSFVFGLSVDVARGGLAVIKSEIPMARKSTLDVYAGVLFRAWKDAEGEIRREIEDEFLQKMIDHAIHAKSVSLAASIRRFLGGFLSQRTTEGVDKLLFRLAEPILFRSLQVANSLVRHNAMHLLFDMFPLEDPDFTKEAKDTLHQKQYFLMEKLMMDECPELRAVAVEGSCRILTMFWEVIPPSTITKMITKIIDLLARDGSSSDVRLSAVSGITYLLSNPHSHEVLKVLLPRLEHLIWDPAISVRAAIVDLLLQIKDIRNFQFHKVVRLDKLLVTLANDQPSIACKITKLLMPSYFPLTVTTEEACNRCITLIKRSATAGARFCEFTLSEGAPLHSLLELFKVLVSLAPNNTDHVDDLLVAAAYICKHLVNDAFCKDTIKKLLSGEKLKLLFQAATRRQAQAAICDIISSILPDDVDGLFGKCMVLVTDCCNLPDNAQQQTEVRSVHKMMLSCNWFNKMLESMSDLMQKAVYGCHILFGVDIQRDIFLAQQRKLKSSTKKAKRGAGRKSPSIATSFEDDYSVAVGIAWQLKDLLMDEETRKAMLEAKGLDTILIALKVISEVSIVYSTRCNYMQSSPVSAYTSLALHMSSENFAGDDANKLKTKKRNPDSAGTSGEPTLMGQTIDHVLDCSNMLFEGGNSGKFGQYLSSTNQDNKKANNSHQEKTSLNTDASEPRDTGNHGTEGALGQGSDATSGRRILHITQILTSILKFFMDASTMDLVYQGQERGLKFTLNYMKFITTYLKKYSIDKEQFEVEDIKETLNLLKTAFTYIANLLSLSLAYSGDALSTAPTEAHDLANSLLDLIVSVELYVGPRYATSVTTAIKSWLPDLVLGMASKYFRKNKVEMYSEIQSTSNFPLWATSLAKIEIQELNEASSDEETDGTEKPRVLPAFKKFMEVLIPYLRSTSEVLDSVGLVFFTNIATGLEKKDYGIVLGLMQFVCGKLVKSENKKWEELNATLAFVREFYPQMQKAANELKPKGGEVQSLQRALLLLEPIWTNYVDFAQ